MTLHKLLIAVPSQSIAEAISGILENLPDPEALAVSLFEHGDGAGTAVPAESSAKVWSIEAYYGDVPDQAVVRDAISDAGIPIIDGPGDLPGHQLEMTCDVIPDENWVALSQQALPPVKAGRFVVHGSHDRSRASLSRYAIEIDAGEAFGTAHHETTLGCLLAIDQLSKRRSFSQVLDLGCGSGVLAIAAAMVLRRKLQSGGGAAKAWIIASDIDPQATKVAAENVRINAQQQYIDVVTAIGFQHPKLQGAGHFDLVIANILAAPLVDMAAKLARATKPGGFAVLSGLLNEQAAEVLATYVATGFKIAEHKRLSEWSTLIMQRNAR